MMRLSKSLNLTNSDRAQQKSAALSYLVLASLWMLANVASEGLEEFSFWLETGFAVAQWLVLRRYIRQIGWWVLVSVWGWTVAFILIHLFGVGNWISGMVPGGELGIGGLPVIPIH